MKTSYATSYDIAIKSTRSTSGLLERYRVIEKERCRMTEKERRAADSEEVSSWTYDIPFQYVWREARMFSWTIEPEQVASYIEGDLDGTCRIKVEAECDEAGYSSVQLVTYDLLATCPFCKEGDSRLHRTCFGRRALRPFLSARFRHVRALGIRHHVP